MNVVHEDIHGVFVKTGGYIFRPQPSYYGRHYSHVVRNDAPPTTTPKVGEKVAARHIGGTPTGRVAGTLWFSHGSYLSDATGGTISSTLCWEPADVALCSVADTNPQAGTQAGSSAPVRCHAPVRYGSKQCRKHQIVLTTEFKEKTAALLRDELRDALVQLRPDLPAEVIDNTTDELLAISKRAIDDFGRDTAARRPLDYEHIDDYGISFAPTASPAISNPVELAPA